MRKLHTTAWSHCICHQMLACAISIGTIFPIFMLSGISKCHNWASEPLILFPALSVHVQSVVFLCFLFYKRTPTTFQNISVLKSPTQLKILMCSNQRIYLRKCFSSKLFIFFNQMIRLLQPDDLTYPIWIAGPMEQSQLVMWVPR